MNNEKHKRVTAARDAAYFWCGIWFAADLGSGFAVSHAAESAGLAFAFAGAFAAPFAAYAVIWVREAAHDVKPRIDKARAAIAAKAFHPARGDDCH